MTDDSDVVEAMKNLKRLGLTVHVRGTDERPIVEFRHKYGRRVVGGIELRKLMETRRP